MKAEEPSEPLVKYGMAASEQDRLVARHFKVTQEERAVTAFHFAHALSLGPLILTPSSRVEEQAAPSVAEPYVAPPQDDLRRSLGLR
jgi:hypothetical protein